MTDIQPHSFAVGIIFPYPEPFQKDKLAEWFSQQGYDIMDQSENGISIGPQGVQIGNGDFAVKNDTTILYNPNANLDGLPNSSFITVKDAGGADFERVSSEVANLWEGYNEFDIESDSKLIEATFEGRIRISRGTHDFSEIFDEGCLSPMEDHFGHAANPVAARFEADVDSQEYGWYRLLLDTAETQNPNLWSFKLQYRVESPDNIQGESLVGILEQLIEETAGG